MFCPFSFLRGGQVRTFFFFIFFPLRKTRCELFPVPLLPRWGSSLFFLSRRRRTIFFSPVTPRTKYAVARSASARRQMSYFSLFHREEGSSMQNGPFPFISDQWRGGPFFDRATSKNPPPPPKTPPPNQADDRRPSFVPWTTSGREPGGVPFFLPLHFTCRQPPFLISAEEGVNFFL